MTIDKHSQKKLLQFDFIDLSIKFTELIKCFLVFFVETEESQTPVAPQVQDDSSSSTETQWSGVKRHNETVDAEDHQPANKYQRFELESDDFENSWALPSGQATYVRKYIATHISPKDIKENILSVTPVPSNIKNSQNLDEYIKELLVENKKNNTLNQEKVLNGIQDQVVTILAPLSKLWSTMELERNAVLEEELNEGHREMANLFEQTVLLTAQTYNSLAYQRRMNVLSALTPNSTKVKKILKEKSLELGGIENKYLFGEKFEEKLSKITTAKQKFKTKFTGLQKSLSLASSPSHLPFRVSPLF